MNTTSAPVLDLEAWGRPTAEQAEHHRLYGPRRVVHPDDPIPEVPYAERTVRQVIFTFSKVNPAWGAEVQAHRTPRHLAALLAWLAREWGLGPDDVMGQQQADRLEQALERIAVDSFATDPPGFATLTRAQRAAWFEGRRARGLLRAEDD